MSSENVEVVRAGALYTIRNGKIVRLQWFDEKAQALDAAGLWEQP